MKFAAQQIENVFVKVCVPFVYVVSVLKVTSRIAFSFNCVLFVSREESRMIEFPGLC